MYRRDQRLYSLLRPHLVAFNAPLPLKTPFVHLFILAPRSARALRITSRNLKRSSVSFRRSFSSRSHSNFRMHITFENGIDANAAADKDVVNVATFSTFSAALSDKFSPASPTLAPETDLLTAIHALFEDQAVASLLVQCSKSDVFSANTAAHFPNTPQELGLLRSLKLLKYCYNLPCGQLYSIITDVVAVFNAELGVALRALADRILESQYGKVLAKDLITGKNAPQSLRMLYEENAEKLLKLDPHAVFPTSIYRQCFGHVTSSDDSTRIEGVMGTTITTTIEIVSDVLAPSSTQLRKVYKPLGRCVCVIDERVDALHGAALVAYFQHHEIKFEKLVYRCMEVDKDISTVERMLVDLKSRRVSRHEPVLVVGGGVMADIGGFACALYHRNTPYVMLCTSIVSGIDAGPSPRTCCDGLGYKNVFGAYHPPILTLTDRKFFKTLKPGWIRHGIAEIIKMGVSKDYGLFELLEEAGSDLVETKFGIENCEPNSRIDQISEQIIARAMDAYVRSEYGNLWETHQCRPHAYGHTWSPGFELQAGLLHGHAVAIGMGFGAYLSFINGWISEEEFHRVLKVISTMGLSLRHEVLVNTEAIWQSNVKMVEKRGGNLCAPIPRGGIGKCGYLNEMTKENLIKYLKEYEEIVKRYARDGFGIDPHCKDVGLEDPSTVKQHADNAVLMESCAESQSEVSEESGSSKEGASGDIATNGTNTCNIDIYNNWIASSQTTRNTDDTSSKLGTDLSQSEDTAEPPTFPQSTLFHAGAEEYANSMTSVTSPDFHTVVTATDDANLFAPCMVGRIEGEFLRMVAKMTRAKRVLDIGTFTGYSAVAFAEGMGDGGKVVTIEADEKTADVAQSVFNGARFGKNITLIRGDAKTVVSDLQEAGDRFDIVFIDADKTNYAYYYEGALELVNEGGLIMADNAMCSLLYDQSQEVAKSLHSFAQKVRADDRVTQCMVTVREGILMVMKK